MTLPSDGGSDPLLAAVRQAAAFSGAVRAAMGSDSALTKEDCSPVTVADFGVQALLCRAVRDAFPALPIVAEERSDALRQPANRPLLERMVHHARAVTGDASLDGETLCDWIDLGDGEPGEAFWTLDPIDGTKGFLRGDQYAIALARIADGQPQLGYLACPAWPHRAGTGLILAAERGAGCRAFTLEGQPLGPVRVSTIGDPAQARIAESVQRSHSDHGLVAALRQKLGIVAPPRRIDSQAKYAAVALGEAELYLRIPTARDPDYRECIWDHAAGVLAVQEAGGTVTDLDGKPLDWTQGRRLHANRGILASNALLHDCTASTISALLV